MFSLMNVWMRERERERERELGDVDKKKSEEITEEEACSETAI